MAMHDVFRGDDGEAKADLIAEITTAAQDRRFIAIILDSHWRRQEIEPYYEPRVPIFTDPASFWPVTGKRTRPTYLFTPK
jgi:hypothetical protein